VVAVTVSVAGAVFRLDGTDDQCGAALRGSAFGSAFTNPDGTIGLGFVVEMSPGGQSVAVDALIDLGTLSGTWRDQFGHVGTFAFTPGPGTGGPPLPPAAGVPIAAVVGGPGLTASASGGTLDLAVAYGGDGSATAAARADHTHTVRVPQNTAVGPGALEAMRTATSIFSDNTAVGAAALRSTTVGAENAAAGVLALGDNVQGLRNVAVGAGAMGRLSYGSYNVAIGASAMALAEGTVSEIGVGHSALASSTNGVSNVAIGFQALMRNTTGVANVAIGANAGFGASPTASRGIYIGSAGDASDVNTIRIGDGNHVAAFIGGAAGRTVAGGVPVLTAESGRLGTLVSSARFKQDIRPVPDWSDRLGALRPVRFTYAAAAGGDGSEVQYGLLAEEVAAVFPELVAHDSAGRPWGVRYQLLDPLLLAEIQRLERARGTLAQRLLAIRARLDALAATSRPGGDR
jgi:hypothetical protein